MMPTPPSPTGLDFWQRFSGWGLVPVVLYVASCHQWGIVPRLCHVWAEVQGGLKQTVFELM